MKKWHRITGTSIITGLIVFCSTLSMSFPPSQANIWAATIGAILSFLPQIKEIFQDPKEIKKKRENGSKPLGVFL